MFSKIKEWLMWNLFRVQYVSRPTRIKYEYRYKIHKLAEKYNSTPQPEKDYY